MRDRSGREDGEMTEATAERQKKKEKSEMVEWGVR